MASLFSHTFNEHLHSKTFAALQLSCMDAFGLGRDFVRYRNQNWGSAF